eukprot:361762-Chlamydomonas_euryale.AAC.5
MPRPRSHLPDRGATWSVTDTHPGALHTLDPAPQRPKPTPVFLSPRRSMRLDKCEVRTLASLPC